ncbi:hypothetical protein IW262DRAFT_272180 [Armillaria fumosa]|nr:hypothetical protein IW262DRAFT_272180 [Armillaria fumosa]
MASFAHFLILSVWLEIKFQVPEEYLELDSLYADNRPKTCLTGEYVPSPSSLSLIRCYHRINVHTGLIHVCFICTRFLIT